MFTCVADLRNIHFCLIGPFDNVGQGMVTSLMFVKGLLYQPSRHLELDKCHKARVPFLRISNCQYHKKRCK